MSNARFDWIDIAKGFGIIAVVIGHANAQYNMGIIANFDMPLFFIIAGFLFNPNKWLGLTKRYCISRFQRLIIPYFGSCVFFYTFWVVIGRHFGESAEKNIPVLKPLLGILYGNAVDHWLTFNTPLWFLPCLFVAEILFITLLHNCHGNQVKLTLGAIMATMAGFLISQIGVLPWGIDIALFVQMFMLLGYTLRTRNGKHSNVSAYFPHSILLLIISSALLIAVHHMNGSVGMCERAYHNVLLFYLGGVSGSVAILIIARLIMRVNIVKAAMMTLGKQTLPILIFHGIAFKVFSLFAVFYLHIPLKTAQQSLWLVYVACGCMIPVGIGLLDKKYQVTQTVYGFRQAINHPRL